MISHISEHGPNLDVLSLALANENAVKVELLVGQLHLGRSYVSPKDYHCLGAVLELDRQLQGSNSVRKPLSARRFVYRDAKLLDEKQVATLNVSRVVRHVSETSVLVRRGAVTALVSCGEARQLTYA